MILDSEPVQTGPPNIEAKITFNNLGSRLALLTGIGRDALAIILIMVIGLGIARTSDDPLPFVVVTGVAIFGFVALRISFVRYAKPDIRPD